MLKPNLASVKETKRVLDFHGLFAKKSFGQNFLVNQGILDKISMLAELVEDDIVLEIGPGIGTLTQILANKAGYVYSVELDYNMVEVLLGTCKPWQNRIEIIHKDALQLNGNEFDNRIPNKLVANLPYNIGATILLKIFEKFEFIESATIMLQNEVVERILAVPGTKNYGAYTLKLALYSKVNSKFLVKPNNFYPVPHVNSCVVRLDRFNSRLTTEELNLCKKFISAAFANRRKTLLNSFKSYFKNDNSQPILQALPGILRELSFHENVRGENLEVQDYIKIVKKWRALQDSNLRRSDS